VGIAPRPARGQVWLVHLDPTQGSEIRKMRPCVVISPDEMNPHLNTVLIAPLTTGNRPAPYRIGVDFQGKAGRILLDHVRSVDKMRLAKYLGDLAPGKLSETLTTLQSLFLE